MDENLEKSHLIVCKNDKGVCHFLSGRGGCRFVHNLYSLQRHGQLTTRAGIPHLVRHWFPSCWTHWGNYRVVDTPGCGYSHSTTLVDGDIPDFVPREHCGYLLEIRRFIEENRDRMDSFTDAVRMCTDAWEFLQKNHAVEDLVAAARNVPPAGPVAAAAAAAAAPEDAFEQETLEMLAAEEGISIKEWLEEQRMESDRVQRDYIRDEEMRGRGKIIAEWGFDEMTFIFLFTHDHISDRLNHEDIVFNEFMASLDVLSQAFKSKFPAEYEIHTDDVRICVVCDDTKVVGCNLCGIQYCIDCTKDCLHQYLQPDNTRLVSCVNGFGMVCQGQHAIKHLIDIPVLCSQIYATTLDKSWLTLAGKLIAKWTEIQSAKAAREESCRVRQELESLGANELILKRWEVDILVDCCPGCKTSYIQEDGCEAMVCTKCDVDFCNICLQKTPGDAHGHVARCAARNGIDMSDRDGWFMKAETRETWRKSQRCKRISADLANIPDPEPVLMLLMARHGDMMAPFIWDQWCFQYRQALLNGWNEASLGVIPANIAEEMRRRLGR